MRRPKSAESCAQRAAVDLDAVLLHRGEDAHQRAVEGLVDPRAALLGEALLEQAVQAQREIGAARRIGHGALDRHLVEADPLAAAAADRLVGQRLDLEMELRELGEPVAVGGAVDRVGQQLDVVVGLEREPESRRAGSAAA